MREICKTIAGAILLLLAGCTPPNAAKCPVQPPNPWVIRTHFSDDERWSAVCDRISAPQSEAGMQFYAYVDFVSDQKHQGKQPHELVRSLPDDYPQLFCFVVDRKCIESPEHPVLVIGFYPSDNQSFDRPPREAPASDMATFRALPSQVQAIENNLSIANMDFEEFADSVDEDGIFRGFAR